jgi:HEAT repeat protein
LGNIDFINIRAEDALVVALEDAEPGVRAAALAALVNLGAELPDNSLEMLTRFMDNEDAGARTDAIKALGMLGREAEQALPVIEAAMTDSVPEIRHNAAWALGRMGDAHADKIVPLLGTALTTDEDEDVRIQSAWALGQMGKHARAASAALNAALEDPEIRVRRESYETLKIVARSAGGHENLEAALASLVPAKQSCDAPE